MTGTVRRKMPWTYERILRKYVLRGVHPLSAKAQADEWLAYRLARERREGKTDGS